MRIFSKIAVGAVLAIGLTATAAEARINDVLRDAVITRDRPALLEILRRARAKAKAGKFKPIVLPPRPAGREGP